MVSVVVQTGDGHPAKVRFDFGEERVVVQVLPARCWHYAGTIMAPRWRFVKGSRGEIASGTSCPVAMHDRDCAARALGLPPEHRVAIVISFGYPESEESRHRGVPRTPLSELVHYERW